MPRLGIAVLALCAAAQAAPRWTLVRSPHFELLTSAGEKRGREAALFFERVRAFFLEANRWTDESPRPVHIVAFNGEAEYRPFRKNDFSAAYFVASGEEEWIVMREIGPSSYPVAVHEYSHVALRRAGLRLPPWLSEGLAELHSTLRASGDRVEIGHFIPARAAALGGSNWIGIEALASAGYDSPLLKDPERARLFYAESWALTHMLALSDVYRPRFRAFLKAVNAGAGLAAFEQVYGRTPAAVQRELAGYVARNAFPTAVFPLKLKSAGMPVEVRPAAPLESGATLAALLAAGGDLDAARGRYEELARDFPKEPSIEEALAYLQLRAGRRGDAGRHLAKAAALGSTNAQVYFDGAMLLGEAGAPEAEIAAMLKRAAELKPGFDDANYFLGLSLTNQARFREALAALSRVARVAPDRASTLARAKARAHHALGNAPEARAEAERAMALAQTADDRTKSEELLAFLKQPDSGVRRISGGFDELECLGKAVRIWIVSNARRVAFDVEELEKVNISGGSFDFACGPQNGRLLVLEYETAGRRVKSIELR